MHPSPSYGSSSLQTLMYFPTFYGNLAFIITFIRTFHWFIPPSSWIQPVSTDPISVPSSLILHSHTRQGFPGGLDFQISSLRITTVFVFLFFPGVLHIVLAPDDRWWWLWSNWWNEDWQGKPKYLEKTCRCSATLSTTNPRDQTRARTRATTVGNQWLTAWAMARPVYTVTMRI
jgi:hypothetical protein